MLAADMREGLPPNGAAHLMRLRCPQATARTIADIMVETFDPYDVAASAFEERPQSTPSQDWCVEVYFQSEPDTSVVRNLIAAVAGEEAAREACFEDIAQKDWVASSLSGLSPVEAGRFFVHGSHDRTRVRPHAFGLEIEAALAFGTGHHGTTRGCLLALDEILRRRRPVRTLDVGTGTGVLAMAAARALKRRIFACDIDPIAVAAARANARANRLAPFLRLAVAGRPDERTLRQGAPYDLIFANILAGPLRKMAANLARLAAPGSDLVLSGLIAPDVAGVLAIYAAHGFRLRRRVEIEGWTTLAMRRRAGSLSS